MASIEEKIKELEDAYRARYGEGCIVDIKDNGMIKNTPYRHYQLWYKDDNGIVQCNHDIYIYIDANGNAEWYNKDPTKLPAKPSTEKTFTQKLREKIEVLVNNGVIKYAEIIASDDKIKRARVFVKTDAEEGIFIAYLDKDGNLVKEATNYDKIVSQ